MLLLADLGVQRARERAGGVRKLQIGVLRRELPARRAAQFEALAADLLIERERRRAGFGRSGKQREAVGEPLARQVAGQDARADLRDHGVLRAGGVDRQPERSEGHGDGCDDGGSINGSTHGIPLLQQWSFAGRLSKIAGRMERRARPAVPAVSPIHPVWTPPIASPAIRTVIECAPC